MRRKPHESSFEEGFCEAKTVITKTAEGWAGQVEEWSGVEKVPLDALNCRRFLRV